MDLLKQRKDFRREGLSAVGHQEKVVLVPQVLNVVENAQILPIGEREWDAVSKYQYSHRMLTLKAKPARRKMAGRKAYRDRVGPDDPLRTDTPLRLPSGSCENGDP
jgi:hypothetical protein